MPDTGSIRGTHHLTFCVGGAQEDYDFHVRLLGLKSVKKTVLFDGEIPIYHLYYGNRRGDASTILTSFPYRQAGWMGRRGTNQLRTIRLAVPADALGFWSDRLAAHGVEHSELELFGTPRLAFRHPCGIHYAFVGDARGDDREPFDGSDVPAEHAIRGAHGTTTSVREAEPMDHFLQQGMRARHVASDGPHHQYEVGDGSGHARLIELVEEPDLPQGTWHFGEGTIHHHAFDVGSAEDQAAVKDWIVGLGYTDVSDVKDRGYFYSVYCRTPGGALFEFAYSTPQGFLIDEAEDELGTHMCIPPHWEDRRQEISQLEPIDTEETVVGAPGS
jgi:glyoxalase family protein